VARISFDEMRRIEQLKRTILSRVLSRPARERLGRLRLVKPQFVAQVELYLIQLYQAGKISGQVTDEQLKQILRTLSSGRRFRLRR
jgi:programmed cell death protein 5